MSDSRLNMFSFTGKMKILHLSWFAFFLTFIVWFNHAPLLASIRETFGLSDQEIKALLILNVALTIPARIIIGMLVDKLGPRIVYSVLLAVSGFLCFGFALSTDYQQLALMRFLLGFAGAGFVIGIRLVAEWFPAKQVGIAEGIYGGWGNFGSAAAAMMLPVLALAVGGENGWRYALMTTGVMVLAYSFIFYFNVQNTPKGSTYFKPKKTGAMEVTSRGDLLLYLIMNIPLYAALAVLTWKLGPSQLKLLAQPITVVIYGVLTVLYIYQSLHTYRLNKHIFKQPVPEFERYPFKQVAVLNLAYMVTFGSELAVVSMLPLYFKDTFSLSMVSAGLLASGYAWMCLVARPAGGLISDKYGRKRTLLLLLVGSSVGYLMMSFMDSTWPVALAVIVSMACSLFVQAGNGAVFAMVPLVKRRLTGQIAGMSGAYGNVGGVYFLTVYSLAPPQVFFLMIGISALLVTLSVYFFLADPKGHMVETLPDGTVQMIEVH